MSNKILPPPEHEFISWKDAWEFEKHTRQSIKPEELCHFGIKALDDAIPFIQKNDFIVIGADSGSGKSEIALKMALHNAENKKRTALFYLEGDMEEAMARMKFHILSNKNYKYLDFTEWRCNKYDLYELEDEIKKEFEEKLKDNLFLYSVGTNFNIQHFQSSMYDFHTLEQWINNAGKIQLDLIIVDHLQYFDLPKGEHEISATTQILKDLKTFTNEYKVPVILISHLRKKTRDRGLPDQEDFYGSSNIPKIATNAIVLCQDKSKQDYSDGLYPTFIRFVKSRIGLRSTYAIRANFNMRTRKYLDEYELYYINSSDNQPFATPIAENKLPEWARKRNIKQEVMEYDK